MDQLELERWLCDYALTPTPPTVVATALGLPAGKLAWYPWLRCWSKAQLPWSPLPVVDTFVQRSH